MKHQKTHVCLNPLSNLGHQQQPSSCLDMLIALLPLRVDYWPRPVRIVPPALRGSRLTDPPDSDYKALTYLIVRLNFVHAI
jgi:hypothetical protein